MAAHVNKKSRESIKRCQSVEVLSRNRIEESTTVESPSPPPLPPKNAHLDGILNSEALANSNLVIEKPLKNVHSKTTYSTKSPTVIASLRGPFHYRRRSALLFGINEVELPAPDTVKETRKIFENQNRSMVKSKSTSNLIQRPAQQKSTSPVRGQQHQKIAKSQNFNPPKSHLVTAKPALPAKPFATKVLDLKKKPSSKPSPPIIKAEAVPAKVEAIDIEEGIKIVSKDSINKIRSSGESFSFNFNKKSPEDGKPGYLPKAKTEQDKVPVGVIKPITRHAKEPNKKPAVEPKAVPPPPPPTQPAPSQPAPKAVPKQARAESPTTTLNNLINLTKQTKNSENNQRKKEVISIPDKNSVKSNKHKVVTFADDQDLSKTKDNSTADEGIDTETVVVAELETMKCNKGDNNNSSSWKKTESKNTIVFNFLNSQKDVTHIENDGLDLSKRKKKQHLQQFAKVSPSSSATFFICMWNVIDYSQIAWMAAFRVILLLDSQVSMAFGGLA